MLDEQCRYRDWDNLQYWFRCVEKYCPWVRKIHIVTCGHFPEFLVKEHPKLNFVTHDQIIDAACLPTFSSHVIEINLHKIESLAEHFVYFNDDMFITQPLLPEFFFREGLPCDGLVLQPLMVVGEENFWVQSPSQMLRLLINISINASFSNRCLVHSLIFIIGLKITGLIF